MPLTLMPCGAQVDRHALGQHLHARPCWRRRPRCRDAPSSLFTEQMLMMRPRGARPCASRPPGRRRRCCRRWCASPRASRRRAVRGRRRGADAGVVDEHVDRRRRRPRSPRPRRRPPRASQTSKPRAWTAWPSAASSRARRVERAGSRPLRTTVAPACGQPARQRQADAGRRAGDQRDATVEAEGRTRSIMRWSDSRLAARSAAARTCPAAARDVDRDGALVGDREARGCRTGSAAAKPACSDRSGRASARPAVRSWPAGAPAAAPARPTARPRGSCASARSTRRPRRGRRRAASAAATACSQSLRSASVSGVPAAISAMLRGECRSSPSMNGSAQRPRSAAPTVLLPQPLTPITTTTGAPA